MNSNCGVCECELPSYGKGRNYCIVCSEWVCDVCIDADTDICKDCEGGVVDKVTQENEGVMNSESRIPNKVYAVNLANLVKDMDYDLLNEPMFSLSGLPVTELPEGMMVHHEQLGIGIVIRPDRWNVTKVECTYDPEKRVYVIFIGYGPSVLCDVSVLKTVSFNPRKWGKLLEECGLTCVENMPWYSPAGTGRILVTDEPESEET